MATHGVKVNDSQRTGQSNHKESKQASKQAGVKFEIFVKIKFVEEIKLNYYRC